MVVMASITDFAKKISNFDNVRKQLNDEKKFAPFIQKHGEYTLHSKIHKYSCVETSSLCYTFDYAIREDGENDDKWQTDLELEDLPEDILIGVYHDAIEGAKHYNREDLTKTNIAYANKAFDRTKYKANDGSIWLIRITQPIDKKTGMPLTRINEDTGKEEVAPSYDTPIRLSNFTAEITKEVTRDDGVERITYFALSGMVGDRELPLIEVPAKDFAGMRWITELWGSDPVTNAGPLYKDHLRAAIQLLSPQKERHTIYSHVGWRRINDRWYYLHAGGAIGGLGNTTSVEVEPGDSRLKSFMLPDPPYGDTLIKKMHEVLEIIDRDIAPDHVIYPLMGTVFRAPLCEAYDADFTYYLTGLTGTRKTSFIAIFQAFFGSGFNEFNLPGNWTSTANALERLTYLVKDGMCTIDDFAPRGGTNDHQQLHYKADRIIRGQANKAGRQRMKPDRTMAPEYYPRGIVVASGEDVPTGHSLRGRMLIGELQPGDVDLEELSLAQQRAREGTYAEVMAAFVKYLTLKMTTFKKNKTIEELQNKARDTIRNELAREGVEGVHPKTPTTLASIYVGFCIFLDFVQEESLQTFNADFCTKLKDTCMSVLIDLAYKQANFIEAEDPVKRFVKLVQTALTSGYAHVADSKDNGRPTPYCDNIAVWGWRRTTRETEAGEMNDWRPLGSCIGWLGGVGAGSNELNLYLHPESTYTVIQKIARDQGTGQLLTRQTLWRRLKERGILKQTSDDRNTIKVSIDRIRKYVLCIDSNLINELTDTKGA